MNSGINLAGKKVDPKKLALERRIGLLRVGAFVVLAVVCLASVVLFVIIVASPLPRLRAEEEELFLALNSMNTKIQKVVFVDKQLDHIDLIVKDRSSLPEVMQGALGSAPAGLAVESYSATDKLIEITISAKQLNEIEEFLDRITELSFGQKAFANVAISEISLNPSTGAYQVRLSMSK